jgi:hypothetical protein
MNEVKVITESDSSNIYENTTRFMSTATEEEVVAAWYELSKRTDLDTMLVECLRALITRRAQDHVGMNNDPAYDMFRRCGIPVEVAFGTASHNRCINAHIFAGVFIVGMFIVGIIILLTKKPR